MRGSQSRDVERAWSKESATCAKSWGKRYTESPKLAEANLVCAPRIWHANWAERLGAFVRGLFGLVGAQFRLANFAFILKLGLKLETNLLLVPGSLRAGGAGGKKAGRSFCVRTNEPLVSAAGELPKACARVSRVRNGRKFSAKLTVPPDI